MAICLRGGIVVGTAAVEAGLISPVVLIVVSIAGVCGFVLPNRDLAEGIRLWRFAFGLVAGYLGMWGIALGLGILVWHLYRMKCLGVRFLTWAPGGEKTILRRRLKNQKSRDQHLNPELGILVWHLYRMKCLGVRFLTWAPGGEKTILRRRLKNQKSRDQHLNPEDKRNQK